MSPVAAPWLPIAQPHNTATPNTSAAARTAVPPRDPETNRNENNAIPKAAPAPIRSSHARPHPVPGSASPSSPKTPHKETS